MLKSIIFSGGPDEHSWNGTVSESADAKFNRWMKCHESVSVKGIHYGTNDNVQSICVIYDEPNDFVDHLSTIENGTYYVDTLNGRLIMCDKNIDVSYMVKNFIGFRGLQIYDNERTFNVLLKDGKFYKQYKETTRKDRSDGGPVFYETNFSLDINVSIVIHEEFIPGYGNNGANDNKCFSLRENAGKYIIDINKRLLIKADNMLDVSYIVKDFYGFGRELGVDWNEDTIVCLGDTFIRPKADSENNISKDNKTHYQLNCRDVICEKYL